MKKYIITVVASVIIGLTQMHAQSKANISSIRYNNKVIKAFKLNDWRDFSENLCAVEYKKKWGFIDKTKNVVIDFKYKRCWHFSEGLCDVITDSGCAYINIHGEILIPCYKYANNTPFINHIASLTDRNDKNYFINKKGIIISGPLDGYKDFDRFGFGAKGYYINNQKDTLHYILIDTTGKRINNSVFIDIGKWDLYGHLIVLDSSYHVRWLTRQVDFFGDAFNRTAFALYTLYNSKDWTYKFEKDDIWFAKCYFRK